MIRKALIVVSLAHSFTVHADTYPKNANVDVLHYAFEITLSDRSDEIQSAARIEVKYRAAGITGLRFDLVKASSELNNKGMVVTAVESDGKPLTFRHENHSLYIDLPAPSTAGQLRSYRIEYHGIPASGLKIANNKYDDRTFFSDNWPDKGRHWLPMVDHPYDKATCEFIITAPAHYQVVSNGLRIEETDLNDGLRRTHWKQSVPIAPWLYVLGVARFAVQLVDQFHGKSVETWVYPQDRDKGFLDFAEPTPQVLEFYSTYVGPFAYEKLANIQSNSVSGGMEAASAILYGENSVVGDRNERWRNVVIHEIAHQWFGNAVTEYDWDDVWLSEGFATYFTLLFIEHQYGRDEFLKGLADSKKRVDEFHAKDPGYTIIHDNLKDMAKVTSSQTYQKGSWVLHMLRGVVGDRAFREGIRVYYEQYMNQNATTADFRSVMESASGMELKFFFDQWLYKAGALKLNGQWRYDSKKKQLTVQLDQAQADGSLFTMPLEVAIHLPGDQPMIRKVTITQPSNSFVFTVEKMPDKVVLDPESWVLMEASMVKSK